MADNLIDAAAEMTELGYHIARSVVPPDLAEAIRSRVLTRRVHEYETGSGWSQASVMLYDCFDEYANAVVESGTLKTLIDHFVGAGRWKMREGTSWPILFPGFEQNGWNVREFQWHIEGRWYQHRLESPEIGLIMIFLLSDIQAGDGGTAVSIGSHRIAAQILAEHPEGLSSFRLSAECYRRCKHLPVIETIGRAGDVLFLHPLALHAGSANAGLSIRVASILRAALLSPMRSSREGGMQNLPPVEEGIARALAGVVPLVCADSGRSGLNLDGERG